MQDLKIVCPKCTYAFSLSELSEELQKKLEAENSRKFQEKELELEKKLNLEKAKIKAEAEVKLQKDKQEMWAKAQEKALEKIEKEQSLKLKDLENQNKENQKKLAESQAKELEFLKEKRQLEEKSKNLELEIQRKLEEERSKISEKITKDLEVKHHLKLKEYDKQREMMQRQIEDLKRKSEQGSMQIQGEVQENDLKEVLKQNFFTDLIEDVPIGIKGADLVQTVQNNFGQKSGVILWESKNTKVWSDGWLKKLKDDQAEIGADLCVLVTQSMPKDIETFGFKNGVWVTSYPFVLPLISSLRFHLLEVGKIKNSLEGRDEKAELLLNYLASPQFKNRIENIVLAFGSMKEGLETEKRSMQRIWSKREKEIERVMLNTSGFYGDLQGLMGNALPTIERLELE
jgi:hypothetical protein